MTVCNFCMICLLMRKALSCQKIVVSVLDDVFNIRDK